MKNFDYLKLKDCKWDPEIVRLTAKICECKDRQELFIRQKPAGLVFASAYDADGLFFFGIVSLY